MNQEPKMKRPNVITILSILMMVGGILGLINMVLLIAKYNSDTLYAILLLGILSIIAIVLGFGNYKGLTWVWYGTIIFYSIFTCMAIGQAMISSNPNGAQGSSIIGIIIFIAIIYDYMRPVQKAWFNIYW